jgi:hypothetical protein
MNNNIFLAVGAAMPEIAGDRRPPGRRQTEEQNRACALMAESAQRGMDVRRSGRGCAADHPLRECGDIASTHVRYESLPGTMQLHRFGVFG